MPRKLDSNEDYLTKNDKDKLNLKDFKIDLDEFELELFKKFKIKKEDVKQTIHLDIPDSLPEINNIVKQHGSVQAFWGMIYKKSVRAEKLAEEKLMEFKVRRRERCLKEYNKRRKNNKGIVKKQATKDDLEQMFYEIYVKPRDETYMKLKNRSATCKVVRDQMEVVHEVMKQRKDILMILANNVRLEQDLTFKRKNYA